MHPALHSWREELPATLVRLLAYVGGTALLSIPGGALFPSSRRHGRPAPRTWVEIGKPFPAFALSIPEAADMPANYADPLQSPGRRPQRHPQPRRAGQRGALSSGRDLPRRQRDRRFPPPREQIAHAAAASGPTALTPERRSTANSGRSRSSPSPPRKARPANASASCAPIDDPRLQLSGWFCRGGEDPAHDACLRARPADTVVGRQRAQSRRPIREGRAQPLLSAASTIRSWRRRPNTSCYGRRSPTRPAPRRIGR